MRFPSVFIYNFYKNVHFLQIWLLPKANAVKPVYHQSSFNIEKNSGKLNLVVAVDGRDGALKVNQDVDLFASVLREGDRISYSFKDMWTLSVSFAFSFLCYF